ncbi:hypothetical protein HZH68_000385 [Vespula germanica]|uniref:XK-related protein n=1 Tax=Vespula germanica TaxID=30212 RepID=A0A834NTP8_VESGE|nr:hypothetical protein HZH68_000385 [Vespula germanica]
MAQHRQPQQNEFLPLCDVLFNIISLASYFCDIVFDFAMVYALAHHSVGQPTVFPLSITFITTSLLACQIVSIRWYLWGARGKLIDNDTNRDCNVNPCKKTGNWTLGCVLLLHTTQAGVLWRYFKLFIPVDLAYVRELCVLRLIHAFCEAAPMLLLQLYLLSIGINDNLGIENEKIKSGEVKDSEKLTKLTAVSAGLSLWSVCWAVASFSKGAARLRNLERLVLTWLGVLAQLFWRLGTVSARVGALVVYASLYGGQWLLIVMALHWLSMLTWLLLTPDGLFHVGERLPLMRKSILASMLAFVYIFAYVNLHETNHRQKMVIFYTVMLLENSLLTGVWAVGINRSDLHLHQPNPVNLVLTLVALFFCGMFFMALYYRFFHIRRLTYEVGGRMTTSNLAIMSNQDNSEERNIDYVKEKKIDKDVATRKVKLNNSGIPGVFNCRFANAAVVNPNRKKKKPTTFVPPPPPQDQSTSTVTPTTASEDTKQWINGNNGHQQIIPFWKKAASFSNVLQSDDSNIQKNTIETETGSSLSVNLIREKLRQKKQQQLRELKAIQEEIKEGKLFPPLSASPSTFSSSPSVLNQQPPPSKKLHTSPNTILFTSPSLVSDGDEGVTLTSWPPVKMHCLLPPPPVSPYHSNSHSSSLWKVSQREKTNVPEILLAPRCLPIHCAHWTPPGHLNHSRNGKGESSKDESEEGEISDMEGSQVSLPRSYTLPREFKYYHSTNMLRDKERCGGTSKIQPSRFYLPSTYSSDGDVDSADNEEETDSELQVVMKEGHNCSSDRTQQRKYALKNNEGTDLSSNNCDASTDIAISNNSHHNNLYGILRPNQLFKARVKHETKL